MTKQQAFEQHWATVHEVPVESMQQYRWKEKDGYRLPDMASAYRNFCAGWELQNSEKGEGFTRVDMANAARDGFRDGAASRGSEVDQLKNHVQSMIDQTTPLVPVLDEPGWSRRITIDELQAEVADLRKDAERYRLLRQYTVDSYLVQGSFKKLDRDIDSVMSKEG